MDESCHSSGDSSATANAASVSSSTSDQFLRHLNKLSHKISKPSTESSIHHHHRPPMAPPLQQQPPVYNINKSDFRDVVQQLTGSPAHDPSPIYAPKPPSSRLQRIRPPPLVQLSSLPPPMLNCAGRPPLSPLPPLPTCHAASESPISAYMRFLRTSTSISAVDSHSNLTFQMNPPSSSADSLAVSFGCLQSPRSSCPPLSPKLLLSPTGSGPLGFPVSPGIPSP